jgi:hypothetical protein
MPIRSTKVLHENIDPVLDIFNSGIIEEGDINRTTNPDSLRGMDTPLTEGLK